MDTKPVIMTLEAKHTAMNKLSTGTRLLIVTFSLAILTVLFEILLDIGIVFTASTPNQLFQIYSALTVIFIGTGLLITALVYRAFSAQLSLPKIKQVFSNRSLRTFWSTIMSTVFILVLFGATLFAIPLSGKDMLLMPVAMAVILENINNILINLSGLVIIENKPKEEIQENTSNTSTKKSLSAEEVEQLSDDELEKLLNE